VNDRPVVALVDLPALGRPAVLVWRKRRWRCRKPDCEVGTWTENDSRIAPLRALVRPPRRGLHAMSGNFEPMGNALLRWDYRVDDTFSFYLNA
jgi:hypothetical protein